MGYLPQQSSVFGKLTTEQNLIAMMELLNFPRQVRRTRCDELLEQFKISHVRRTRAGRLSGGGATADSNWHAVLVSRPEIIMLDEPFAGIDPVTVQNIQTIIRTLSREGISILITDHGGMILQITHRTYVVSEGRILCSGTADDIIRILE